MVCVGAGFEGYREPWQRSGDGTSNLLDVVKIKRISAPVGEGLGHNYKVGTAAGGRNSKVKEQRLPSARNRGYCVYFAGVGRLKLHLDHGTYGLGGVNIHRKNAGFCSGEVQGGNSGDSAARPLVIYIDLDNFSHIAAAVAHQTWVGNNGKGGPVVPLHSCCGGLKVKGKGLGHCARNGNGK